jgi:hypothetical protein
MQFAMIYPFVRLFFLFGLTFLPQFAEVQKPVRRVEIHSGWGGLGPSQNSDVTIRRKDGAFVCSANPVEATKVRALVAALEAPPISKPDVQNLGVTPAWLKANVASQHPGVLVGALPTTDGQMDLFKTSFTDPVVIGRVLPQLFAYSKTDDYPFVEVEITFEDGSKLVAKSASYYVYMLPWSIDGQMGKTYNAQISRALSALMPSGTTNKERLAGDELLPRLTDSVMRFIEVEWNLRGSEHWAGDTLNSLRRSYEVTSAEIGPWHHPEYGTKGFKGEMNLHASLHKPGLPANVTDALVLRYVDGHVEGTEGFLETAGKYEELALSVPWLNEYIRKNPRVPVRISYVHNMSFGEKAMRSFAADMKARGREDLTQEVRAQQSQITLLIVGMTYFETYWLVFRDKHMMLWRYGGASGLLKWAPADFPTSECATYATNYGGCSGREIKPEGTLAPEHEPRDQVCMAANRGKRTAVAPSGDELFPVMDHDRAGYIDRTGKVVIPLCFDKVGVFSEGLARFERDQNWGYIDTGGSVVIEPRFPWAQEFYDGLARVQVTGQPLGIDGRWGFIDKTGKVVIAPDYEEGFGEKSNIGADDAEYAFHDGLATVRVGESAGFIDRSGKLVIPPEFKYASSFSEGLAAVTKTSSAEHGWGFIDRTGKWVIPPQLESFGLFHEGLAAGSLGHGCGYIDATGAIVLRPPAPPDEKDCGTVWGDFEDGLSRWRFGKKYGFIDHSGKVIIKPRFDLTDHFSEGLAAVKMGHKWGYIDKAGKMVIKPRGLARVEDFHHGLAFVTTKDGRYGYIDRSGKYVWKPAFLYMK